ncbi:MAG: multifunctional CCA tRNA nucleotidyl transferase/2'3'-cyclic phosphodiesterase/2'nucleotidase/phosphatase [Chromatiales bacterium]
MKVYLVGGAVRDELLGLSVSERDWVVVGATPQQMLELGYRPLDAAFPVFLHPESGDEYALARTERKTGLGYKGFAVDAGPQVTLKQDLLRRDLTINALARDETGNLIDVCNGRGDLDEGLLRHITPAFCEDPVRLLRVARFAAKLGQWGFRVAHGTQALMKKMAASPDLAHLKAERIRQEMWRALGEPQPWHFFEVLQRCGALARLMPEVERSMGQQVVGHGAQSQEALAALKRAVALSEDPVVRLATALYPTAKQVSELVPWLEGLRAGREEVLLLKDLYAADSALPSADASALLQLAGRLKPAQQPLRFERFVTAARALWPTQLAPLVGPLQLAAEVTLQKPSASFYRQGLSGAALGRALQAWRTETLQGRLAALRDDSG